MAMLQDLEVAGCASYFRSALRADCFKILHGHAFQPFLLAPKAIVISLSAVSGGPPEGTLWEISDHFGNVH